MSKVVYASSMMRGVGPDVVLLKSTESMDKNLIDIIIIPILSLDFTKVFVEKLNGERVQIYNKDINDLLLGKYYEEVKVMKDLLERD